MEEDPRDVALDFEMYLSEMRNVFVEMQEMLVGAKCLRREENARAAVALERCSHLHLLFNSITLMLWCTLTHTNTRAVVRWSWEPPKKCQIFSAQANV